MKDDSVYLQHILDGVDFDIVWRVVATDLEPLEEQINRSLSGGG